MRWRKGRRSTNVEDRRGSQAARGGLGGLGGLPIGGTGIGIGTILIALVALFLGGDPASLLKMLTSQAGSADASSASFGDDAATSGSGRTSAADDVAADFVRAILGDTEDVWNELFVRTNRRYEEPKLVLFTDAVRSGCGYQSSQVGPFYCPADSKVYLDLRFFQELATRHGAPGDFAQAYVIAHEVGHHIQNLLGISQQVHEQKSRSSKAQANELSVRLELQADFLAGVWAHHAERARDLLEAGDVEEGLRAASSIGDDTLQRQATGSVRPDMFTHGTSAQRVRWFKRGLETGDMSQGDTFNTDDL